MNIIIIGSDGQLGTDCLKVLGREHRLITPTLAELNLCDENSTISYVTAERPDVVINCAAYTAVDNCEKERDLCRKVNSDGPGLLARACKETGARLIHVSTDYVFDGRKTVPQAYHEDDRVNPLSQYGRTKLDGEKAVQAFCDDYAIVRTAWLYSANGPNFLKTMLRITLADPTAVRKVVNDQYGSLTWSYTLARQLEPLLDSAIQGIVHATADGYSSWYEAACYFLEKMGIEHRLSPCTTSEYPTPAHRPANSILANTVLESHSLSVFSDWRQELDEFVSRHGKSLLQELRDNQSL
jgi:dTDP-4-dehydrorhamnose reductase